MDCTQADLIALRDAVRQARIDFEECRRIRNAEQELNGDGYRVFQFRGEARIGDDWDILSETMQRLRTAWNPAVIPAIQAVMSADPRDWWNRDTLDRVETLLHFIDEQSRWREAMGLLWSAERKLDSSAAQWKATATEPIKKQRGGRRPKGEKTTNELMMAKLEETPEARFWSLSQWSTAIGRSESAISETPMWDKLEEFRSMLRAEKKLKAANKHVRGTKWRE